MLAFVSQPQSLTLSGAIDNIVISSDLDISFILKKAGVTIFESTYSPDADDKITLYDIGNIIETYFTDSVIPTTITAQSTLFDTFTIEVTNGSDADIDCEFVVVKGKIFLEGTHADFFSQYFLTMLQNYKTTKPDHIEYLSFYSSTGAHVITFRYTTLAGDVFQEELYAFTPAARSVYSFPIKFSDVNVDPYAIVSYSIIITCGSAYELQFDFAMDLNVYERNLSFLFANRFGCIEAFSATGRQTRDLNSDNMTVVNTLAGKRRIGYTETRQTANVGIQPSNQQAHWLLDFFEASICYYNAGDSGNQAIVIDEPETAYDPHDAVTRNFVFSFFFANSRRMSFTTFS